MEFAEKYELLQPVTTGAVESFVGRNKARGERVLVHILQCEPQKPNQPTVQWVLEAFRKAAPEPAGIVLETGRYSGTAYAYVVTTLPDAEALAGWIQRYQAQAQETQEIPTAFEGSSEKEKRSVRIETSATGPSVESSERPAARVPVHFTQIFRELDSQANPATPVAANNESPDEPSPADPKARPMPSFEERFPSAAHAAPRWDDLPQSPVPAKPEPTPAGPSSTPDLPVQPVSSGALNERGVAKPGEPGEFTSFWQGPFRADTRPPNPVSPASTPELQKKPSDFTLMFRSGAVARDSSVFTPPSPEQNSARSGMTGWATHAEIMAEKPKDLELVVPPIAKDPRPDVPSSPKQPAVSNDPPIPPPVAISSAPPAFQVAAPPKPVIPPVVSDAATSAFRKPTMEPVPTPEPNPVGPSPYTQVISMKRPPAGDEAGTEEKPIANLPTFAAPSKPAMPAMPVPKLPPLPKVTRPDVKAPKAPKLDTSKLDAKPPVSYWPLVLILSVLFFIAVLLVLYFMLKH